MKLNNKGITMVEVFAAAIILSFAITVIANHLNNAVRLNEAIGNRVEAFNNAEYLANHFVVIESDVIAENLNPETPTDEIVSKYTYDDCTDPTGIMRQIFDNGDDTPDYCQSVFAPNINIEYTTDMIEVYVFESLEANFDHIRLNPGGIYNTDLVGFALTYDGDYYSEGLLDYRVDNIVVLVYYYNDVPLIYDEVIVYEIP